MGMPSSAVRRPISDSTSASWAQSSGGDRASRGAIVRELEILPAGVGEKPCVRHVGVDGALSSSRIDSYAAARERDERQPAGAQQLAERRRSISKLERMFDLS